MRNSNEHDARTEQHDDCDDRSHVRMSPYAAYRCAKAIAVASSVSSVMTIALIVTIATGYTSTVASHITVIGILMSVSLGYVLGYIVAKSSYI